MVVQLDYYHYLCPVEKKRGLLFYKDYFDEFYSDQTTKVQKKILWTLRVIEDLDRIPEPISSIWREQMDFMRLEFKAVTTSFEYSVFSMTII